MTLFVGLHVVCFGDFYQPGPVGHLALYQEKCQQSEDAHMRAGRSLWQEKFRTVVFLTQQMRQDADHVFAKLLMNIREGKRDDAGLALLRSRIVDHLPADERESDDFKTATIVTLRNPLRHAFNCEHALSFARQAGVPVFISHATDAQIILGHEETVKLPRDERLSCLRIADNKTNNLPGYLPLVVGMEYFMKSSAWSRLGCTNGQLGTLVGIVPHPEEELPYADAQPGAEIHLRFMPQALLWKPLTAPSDKPPHFRQLSEAGVIPILPERSARNQTKDEDAQFQFKQC